MFSSEGQVKFQEDNLFKAKGPDDDVGAKGGDADHCRENITVIPIVNKHCQSRAALRRWGWGAEAAVPVSPFLTNLINILGFF